MFQNQDFIRRIDLAAQWNVSLTTLDRWSKTDPHFPRKIKISKRVVGFKLSEAEKWREAKFKAA